MVLCVHRILTVLQILVWIVSVDNVAMEMALTVAALHAPMMEAVFQIHVIIVSV
jgi:hypothetical protein